MTYTNWRRSRTGENGVADLLRSHGYSLRDLLRGGLPGEFSGAPVVVTAAGLCGTHQSRVVRVRAGRQRTYLHVWTEDITSPEPVVSAVEYADQITAHEAHFRWLDAQKRDV